MRTVFAACPSTVKNKVLLAMQLRVRWQLDIDLIQARDRIGTKAEAGTGRDCDTYMRKAKGAFSESSRRKPPRMPLPT